MYRFCQFFPVLEEGVVATECSYFGVAGARARATCSLDRVLHLACGEEPVAGNSYEEDFGLDACVGLFFGIIAGCHVVEVHGHGEVKVGVGVEAAR